MCPGNHDCLGSLTDCLSDASDSDAEATKFYHSTAGGSPRDPLLTSSSPRPPSPSSSQVLIPSPTLGSLWSRVGVSGIFRVREMEPEAEQSGRENEEGKKF